MNSKFDPLKQMKNECTEFELLRIKESIMDFRKAAECRAERQLKSASPSPIRSRVANSNQCSPLSPQRKSPMSRHNIILADENTHPNVNAQEARAAYVDAELAEKDFIINGDRAFSVKVRPRWVLDEEVFCCKSCKMEFDWLNRKHHCRYCGFIYCSSCSANKFLLPVEYGFTEPQRVCDACSIILHNVQSELLSTANHSLRNAIDMAPNSVTRYLNSPYSFSMHAEVQKATYSTLNMFNRRNILHDMNIPIELLSRARGIVYLTTMKVGCVYGVRFGTGILIRKLLNIRENAIPAVGILSDLTNITTRMQSRGGKKRQSALGPPTGCTADTPVLPAYHNTWSAPCAISSVGLSYGLQLGVEVTDYVLFLNTQEALDMFTDSSQQFSFSSSVDVTVGLVGR